MRNKIKLVRLYVLLVYAFFSIARINAWIAPINLFRPSDKFLIPPKWPCTYGQTTIGYEGTIRVKGFLADDEEDNKTFDERRVNALQLWQCEQDGIAAFKNFDPRTKLGQVSQLFINNDDNSTHGIFRPTGKFSVPTNLMFSTRFHFNYDVSLGFFLPYYVMKLSNVRFLERNNKTTFEDVLGEDLLSLIQRVGRLDLGGWERRGIGDLLIQARWARNFPQMKPLLTDVCPEVRLGVTFPTGKRRDEDKLIAFPFGNDGAWGVLLSGGLNLNFSCYLRGAIDVEFLYLFGNKRLRRVKTDLAQTDLFFLTKIPAFKEFGLTQQYNIFLETGNFLPDLSFRVDFRHMKHNEDRLFVCNDKLDTIVINSAESLQEWTTNSFIFSLNYNRACSCPNSWFKPYITAWYKLGFAGKRALLADTLGVAFTLSY